MSDAAAEYPEDGHELTRQVEDTSFWFQHRSRILESVLERFPPGGEIFDVGGGSGFQTLRFQEAGHAAVLVEPGPAGCRNARQRGVVRIRQSTLADLELEAKSVPAVALLDVIEHVDDPTALLTEAARVLRPGGRCYVTVPAYPALWSREDVYACHRRRYTDRLLREQLASAGLRIEWTTHFFGVLCLPVLLLRALPYRLRREVPAEELTMSQEDHDPSGLTQRAIGVALGRELRRIAAGRRSRVGTSILVVATPL